MSKAHTSHPFGRENEVSAQQLVKFFSNCLYLGQWELSAACVKELNAQKSILNFDITQVLQDLARNPHGNSLGCDSLESPQHLSWLCVKHIQSLDTNEATNKANIILQKDVEFRLLLVSACKIQDAQVIRELYEYHKLINRDDEDTEQPPPRFVSNSSSQFLQDCLYAHPALGCTLLHSLKPQPGPHSWQSQHRYKLIKIHLDATSQALQAVKKEVHAENTSGNIPETVSRFYELLSLLQVDIDQGELWSDIESFLHDVLEVLEKDDSPFERQAIYSALLGRQSFCLLEKFFTLELFRHNKRVASEEKNKLIEDAQTDPLTELEKVALGLCQETDRQAAWQHLYLACLKHQRHFLDVIMETCVHLVQHGHISRVGSLLGEARELWPLAPLMLLVCWDHCKNAGDARKLVNTLMQFVKHSELPSLSQACLQLSSQLGLVEFTLSWAKKSLEGQKDKSLASGAQSLYQCLEPHSALYMLHQCACLRSLPQGDLLSFLTSTPHPLPAEGETWTPSPKKTVKFNLEDDSTHDKSCDLDEPINIDHERDRTIYLSYSAMKHFMDAISFCSEAETWKALQKARRRKRKDVVSYSGRDLQHLSRINRSISNGSVTGSSSQESFSVGFSRHRSVSTLTTQTSVSLDTSAVIQEATEQMEVLQQAYEQQAMHSLNAAKDSVAKLYPLKYRVEVLENMFSLLFVTHEDVQECTEDHSSLNSGDEYAEERRRSWDSSIYTGTTTPNLSSFTGSTPMMPRSPITTAETVDMPLAQGDESKGIRGESLQKHLQDLDGKENFLGQEERKRRGSAPGSTNSTKCSSASMNKIGFIANEFIVRDILHILKGLLVDVSAEIYSMHSSPSSLDQNATKRSKEIDRSLSQCMKCSIEDGKLQIHVNRLTQFVSEAMWRFQLVSHDHVPKEVGIIPTSLLAINNSDSEDYEVDFLAERKKRKRKRRLSSSSISGKESVSGRDSETLLCTDGSVNVSSPSRKSRHSRNKGSRSKGGPGYLRPYGGFIPRMLATKETLLNMSLRRGKFTQADQVLKIFNLEDSPNAHEVSFAERFAGAVKKLLDHDSKSHLQHLAVQSQNRSGVSRGQRPLSKPSLANLREVAAAGIASMSVSAMVDQVLGLAGLPGFPAEVVTEMKNVMPGIGAQISEEGIPGMIILDLACAGSRSVDSSMKLVDLAMKRIPVIEEEKPQRMGRDMKGVSSSKSVPVGSNLVQLLGPAGFLKKLRSLYRLHETFPVEQTDQVSKFHKQSIMSILSTVTCPSNVDHLRMFATVIINLEKEVKRGKKAVEEMEQRIKRGEQDCTSGRTLKPLVRMTVKQLVEAKKKKVPTATLR